MRPHAEIAFADFISAVAARLEAGGQQYGERSFDRNPHELLVEIEEELLDVYGWSFILWKRLRRVADSLVRVEEKKSV